MTNRRTFMGVALAGGALSTLLGKTGARQVEQLRAIPLPGPPDGIEWLTQGEDKALGRYHGPFTEKLMLEAVQTCGFKPHVALLSLTGVRDWVSALAGERRYTVSEMDRKARTIGFDVEYLMAMAPGVTVRLECHPSLPPGTIALS
jgi:hypothetical protein